MTAIALTDKQQLEALLRRDVGRHLYALGDLDDFFWPHTTWWGWQNTTTTDVDAVAFLYCGLDVPTLIAQSAEVAPLAALITTLLQTPGALPARFFAHLSPRIEACFAQHHLEPEGLHHRMMLLDRERINAEQGDGVRALSNKDLPAITQFYAESYPGNWFSARMLETGQYVGIESAEGVLACVAGVHVFSPSLKVAALGNIATHPNHRSQGFGKRAVAALCRSLLAAGVVDIGLNVKATNAAAIKLYQNLGFGITSSHGEFLITRAV